MILFGSTKKIIEKEKMEKKQKALKQLKQFQFDLIKQIVNISKYLCTFASNKSYAYLLNVEPSSLVFLEAYNFGFDEVIRTFMDQNGRPLEIEYQINLTLLNDKKK